MTTPKPTLDRATIEACAALVDTFYVEWPNAPTIAARIRSLPSHPDTDPGVRGLVEALEKNYETARKAHAAFTAIHRGCDGGCMSTVGAGCTAADLVDIMNVSAAARRRPSPERAPEPSFTCPACKQPLSRFTDEVGYAGPPRYWCPNRKCDALPVPEPIPDPERVSLRPAVEVAEETLADWPTNTQPVLRIGVRDKIVAALEADRRQR